MLYQKAFILQLISINKLSMLYNIHQQSNMDFPTIGLFDHPKPFARLSLLKQTQTQLIDYQPIGQGFLIIVNESLQSQAITNLIVQNNEDTIFQSKISINSQFEMKTTKTISWYDDQHSNDSQLAISFQSENQRDYYWRLICNKIGQSHFLIKRKTELIMPDEYNLKDVLAQIKIHRDVLEYHLFYSNDFFLKMEKTRRSFSQSNDRNGLESLYAIIQQILANISQKLIYKIFSAPFFLLIITLEKIHNHHLTKASLKSVKIKDFLSFSDNLRDKIQRVLRMNFYREHIMKTRHTHLNQAILLAIQTLSKEIIKQIIHNNHLQELVKMKTLPSSHIITEEAEEQQINKLSQQKIDFLIEAINTVKRTKDLQLIQLFINKMYSSPIIKMIFSFNDKLTSKVLEFSSVLVQASPSIFLGYHKNPFSVNNINLNLAKIYCKSQQFQYQILNIIRYLRPCFDIDIDINLFMETFITYVIQNCHSGKSLLIILSEMIDMIGNSTELLELAAKNNVFYKIISFLNKMPIRYKEGKIMVIKILKSILQSNSSNQQNGCDNISSINDEAIQSGLFQFCMAELINNVHLNNIISSSMLYNLKIIRNMRLFTPYHYLIQTSYSHIASIRQYIANILQINQRNDTNQEDSLSGEANIAPAFNFEDQLAFSDQQSLKRIRYKEQEQQQPNLPRKIQKTNQISQ